METILVVDDDQGMRELIEILLAREGYEVKTAADGREAVELLGKVRFDLVVTDLKMPQVDGIDLLKRVKEVSPETPVIIVTAFASGETALTAMKEGAYDYLEKNFDVNDLLGLVRDALRKKPADRAELSQPQEAPAPILFGRMVGRSKAMSRVYETVRKVADTTANVLILGESGTGKELVARAVHDTSSRRDRPFVVINCGGIPDNLLESELFGYMKGSFSGAYADKPGLFEVAHGGTVFLDEIGELPPFLQVKLLRVVQEKTFLRIGGSREITVDARIISATNQDLEARVREKKFREDLYYRLNVIPLRIPPLRERKEDIPLLVDHFIRKYAREFGKEVRKISPFAMDLLSGYPFPGNVRELENIIERSVALETTNIILPENLILKGAGQEAAVPRVPPVPDIPEGGIDLNAELAAYESEIIGKALKKAGGSKTAAAKLLSVSFDSLRYRMEKLGLD
jgi:two-component system response regulator PilR (NtrC family)